MSRHSIQVDEMQTKLLKLRDQICQTSDYTVLDKCNRKLRNIKQKVENEMAVTKNKRQLNQTIAMIESLIKQRTKQLKKQMIRRGSKPDLNSNRKINQSRHDQSSFRQEAERTLKYSRSADNVEILKNSQLRPPPEKSVQLKSQMENGKSFGKQRNNYQESFVDEETLPAMRQTRLATYEDPNNYQQQRNMFLLNHKVTQSSQKIDELTSKLRQLETKNISPTNQYMSELHSKRQQIFEQLNNKIKQKSFMIEDLKGKNQYLKSMNQQLKTRLLNEQRRHEDYIYGLQNDIKTLKKSVEKHKKVNEELEQDYRELEQKNQAIIAELRKIAVKYDEELKSKEVLEKNFGARIKEKTKQLQEEVMRLGTRLQSYRGIEKKLEDANNQIEKMQAFNTKIEKQLKEVKKQNQELEKNRDKVQQGFYVIIEENEALKKQIKVISKAKQLLADQLLATKDKLTSQSTKQAKQQQQQIFRYKQKAAKMHQLRTLFEDLAVS